MLTKTPQRSSTASTSEDFRSISAFSADISDSQSFSVSEKVIGLLRVGLISALMASTKAIFVKILNFCSGQSYNHFTMVNYDSRVVIWANL